MSEEEPLFVLNEDLDEVALGNLSKEELDELQKVNSETIQQLEADIKLLERKIKHFGPGSLPNKDFHVILRPDGSSNLSDVESRLQKEIDEHTARLKETVRLTGVTIENIERQVLELDDNHCKKQFSLQLLVLKRIVHLKFTLEEPLTCQDSRPDQGAKVTWFEIKFEEDINKAVGADVAKAADELAFHSVFSILKSFLQWQTERDQLITRFTEMYPDNVSLLLSEGVTKGLKIINPKPDHPEFVLEWDRKMANARVEPDIRVCVKAPSRLLEMDTANILPAIPEMFTSMINSLGLEKALDCLIKLVATDGQVVSSPEQQVPPEQDVVPQGLDIQQE